MILGEKYQFQFNENHSSKYNCFFDVLENGIKTGKAVVVNLYGHVTTSSSDVELSRNDYNKLQMSVVKYYKSNYQF